MKDGKLQLDGLSSQELADVFSEVYLELVRRAMADKEQQKQHRKMVKKKVKADE